MTKIFGSIIHKIFGKVHHQPSQESTRYQSIFKKSKAKENQLSPYIIVRATKDDHRNILNLMHEAYFPNEPTCYALGITHNAVLDESALSAMAEGMSLVARCKYDGNIVGACINESTHAWDPDLKEKFACSVRCPKVRQLLLFLAHMQRVPDIWNKYNVNKVFEMSYLFVKKNHRKRGIAIRLLEDSRMMAADCGYKVIRCDATSAHTAKACKKIGMYKIAEIPYCSYLDHQTLEPVFKPPYPHEAVNVFAQVDPQVNKKSRN